MFAPTARTSSGFRSRSQPPRWRSCWSSASWAAGSWPAAARAPDPHHRGHPMAATGSLSHRIRVGRSSGRVPRGSPTLSTPCSARLEAQSTNSGGSRPTPRTNCALRSPSPRPFSTWPAGPGHVGGPDDRLQDPLAINARRSTSPKPAPAQPRGPRSFTRDTSTCRYRGGRRRDAAAAGRTTAASHRDLRRRGPHRRVARAPAAA